MASRRTPKYDQVLGGVRVRLYATRTEYEALFGDGNIDDPAANVRCYPKIGDPDVWANQARAEYVPDDPPPTRPTYVYVASSWRNPLQIAVGDQLPPTVLLANIGLVDPIALDDGWRAIEPLLDVASWRADTWADDVAARIALLDRARELGLAAPWVRIGDRLVALTNRYHQRAGATP